MPVNSADEVVAARAPRVGGRKRAPGGPRMPSTAGYMAAAVVVSAITFFCVGLLLHANDDESPWLLAMLAAGAVLLVAAAAREIMMRRAWARYTREMDFEMGRRTGGPARAGAAKHAVVPSSVRQSAAALRKLQSRLADADAAGAPPEAHLEAYRLCEQYVTNTEDAIRTAGGAADVRAALRAGQERVRGLQKGYLLAWVRGEATRLTQEAQRRVRMSDKIETAQRALAVIDDALRVYSSEPELHHSATAVRNFIASVKVGHWVEMAERAAFRGRFSRAVARYRDALFYLSRAEMGDAAREEAAGRIQREIELLRARIATEDEPKNLRADFDLDLEVEEFSMDVAAAGEGEADVGGDGKQ